jgi:type II secretory pathway pseudopilin PulG
MSDPTPSPIPPPAPVPMPPIPPVKQGMSTGCIIGLVVGAVVLFCVIIIAVLASLAVPTFARIQARAKAVQAMAQMQSLKLAVIAYQVEYSRLPSATEPEEKDEQQVVEAKGVMIDILTGKDHNKNPRQVPFYEPPPPKAGKSGGVTNAQGELEIRDPFGNLYRMHFDWNADGLIPNPEHPGADISQPVIIYSAGPDGDYDTWKDNVKSWGP